MVHSMLVLFAGTGESIPALKTDLIFTERAACLLCMLRLQTTLPLRVCRIM